MSSCKTSSGCYGENSTFNYCYFPGGLPDLVLLDVMMPGHLDGLSVCRAIKGNPELAAIPVVMVSALTQASDLELAREAGADDYLTKPFSLLGLMATIDRLIGKQSADRE